MDVKRKFNNAHRLLNEAESLFDRGLNFHSALYLVYLLIEDLKKVDK